MGPSKPPMRTRISLEASKTEAVMFMTKISTLTLVSGWSDAMYGKLREATKRVVKANPILGGTLIRDGVGYNVELKPYCERNHISYIQGPEDFDAPEDLLQSLEVIKTEIEPFFSESATGTDELLHA